MPEILIDDKKVQFEGKANIVDLAKSVGIDIPTFCYHPGLSVSGNCRMCMVEVGMPAREKDGSIQKDENGNPVISFIPKPQPACYQTPADGMVIRTNTEKVIETRKRILEFLLINHPLDCPVCDQAGECVLQDYSFQYGFTKSRFFEEKRTFEKKEISDVITPELNRCVHCDRCSRFSREIANDHAFTRTWRGNHTELATLPGKKITHNYQGNMVDICPVGALTLTDFRFKSRVWFLKNSEGICTSCGKGCNVVYSLDKQYKVLRIKPRYNADVNSYWMCDYGRLRHDFLNENRATAPKIGGSDAKLDAAVNRAKELIGGASKIGVLASANETNENNAAFAQFVRNVLKTDNVDFRIHPAQQKNDTSLKEGEILLVNDPYPNSAGAGKAGLIPKNGGMSATDLLAGADRVDLMIAVVDDKIVENETVLSALKNHKNLILFTPHASPLDTTAAVLLPIPVAIEQSGTYTNVDGKEQKMTAAVQPGSSVRTLSEYVELLSQGI